MELNLSPHFDKPEVFNTVKTFLEYHNFKTVNSDENSPWGGFYVIDESQSAQFINFFFKDVPQAKNSLGRKLSPKILIVEAKKRLSWQYHHRRAEVWRVIDGEVGIITSGTDDEGDVQLKKRDDIIILKQGERHRLVGTSGWGIIAEIWQHTDPDNPSNEEDIIRLQDDYGR